MSGARSHLLLVRGSVLSVSKARLICCRSVSARQWPLLSTWRWLVHIPSRHAELTSDVAGHSASAVLAEGESDLAHRGVLPMDLGNAILRAGRSLAEYQVAPLDDLAPEQFAHLLHPDQLADELAQASARRIRLKPILDFTTLLLHGLRAIRYHYATRMSFFISCVKLHMHQPEAVPHPLVPAARSPSDRFSAWCSTPAGQGVLQQLCWLAPTQPILVARLQAELGTVPASSQARWVSLSQSRGVPIRTGTSLSWGFHLSWDDAKSLLHTRCTCDLAPWSYPSPLSPPHLRESANSVRFHQNIALCLVRSNWSLGLHQLPADNSLSSTLWPLELWGASSICPHPRPHHLPLPRLCPLLDAPCSFLSNPCAPPRCSARALAPRLLACKSRTGRCRSQCRSANRPQLPSHQTLAPSLPPEALGAHPCFNHSHRLSICFCRCS